MDAKRDMSSAMLAKLMPELSMLLSIVLLVINPFGPLTPHPAIIGFALAVEGVSLMFFCTLVDIASRVQMRPPWWVGVLIVGGVLLMYPDLITVLKAAFVEGMWVFLPLLWSLVERIRELWTLPGASKQEKIRRRTLTFDRLWVGFTLVLAATACAIVVVFLHEDGLVALLNPIMPVTVALVYYALAAVNAWRVHQPAFTKRPTSLVPWLDRGDGTNLSPL